MIQQLPPSFAPVVKAIRDLEQVDLDLLLKIASALPKIRGTGTGLEIKPVRHTDWAIAEVRRHWMT